VAQPGWVSGRLRRHRQGAHAVACALDTAERTTPALAAHLLQHSERMPHLVPPPEYRFGVSFSREVLERFGRFGEDLHFAEDVAMNVRLLMAGFEIAWAPEVVTA